MNIPRGRRLWIPGTWAFVFSENRTEMSVVFTCPNGHPGHLDDHKINTEGEVKPSVLCPADGCDFHEFIVLEDYGER